MKLTAPAKSVMGLALVEFTVVAAGVAMQGAGAPGWHWALRWTARCSGALFLAAFLASSLHRALVRNWTAWLLRRRRYFGVGFAASQAIHLLAIAGAYHYAPATMPRMNVTILFGGVGYLFIAALALTSTDGAVRRLGARRWRLLHSTGVYYLWFIFMATYALNAWRDRVHLAMAVVFGAALAFKLGAKLLHAKSPKEAL